MSYLLNGSIIVQGDVTHIFNLWADFENFPKFVKHIKIDIAKDRSPEGKREKEQ